MSEDNDWWQRQNSGNNLGRLCETAAAAMAAAAAAAAAASGIG